MAGVLLAILLLVTSVGLPVSAEDTATAFRDLRVTDAYGPVTLAPAENPKAPVPVDEDTPLKEEDVVATGPQGQAELTIDGETVFRLQPNSRFKVLKIYPTNTQFEISQGGVLAKVRPVEREDDAIILKLPTAVVAIRGTELGAETADGVSHVGVFDEGHVAVAGAWGHEHILLGPNQETHIPISNVPVPPQGLYRFRARRAQMEHVRLRQTYWKAHWSPIGPHERKRIRDRVNAPVRFHVQGFRHSAMATPKSATIKPKRSAPAKRSVRAQRKAHARTPRRTHAPMHRTTHPKAHAAGGARRSNRKHRTN